MMKKVMFLLVGMLFAASVNAATLSLEYLGGSSSGGALVDNGQVVSGASHVDGQTSTSSNWGIETSADGTVDFGLGFSQLLSDGTSASLTLDGAYYALFEDSVRVAFSGPATSAGAVFSYYLLENSEYLLQILGDASGVSPTTTQLRLSSVPVPAALFLFAPALLGFFGLRRKAAVAA